MIGLFFIVSGVIYYFTLAKDDRIIDTIIIAGSGLFGIISLLFPTIFLKPFVPKGEFIKIDNENITWKIKPERKTKTIIRSEIEKIKFYVGQIHFTTTSGEKHILESHKIYNEEKHKELGEIIKDMAESINPQT